MTKELAREWFMNGFETSGEGFNGEYMRKGAEKHLDEEFELYWVAYEKDKNDRNQA